MNKNGTTTVTNTKKRNIIISVISILVLAVFIGVGYWWFKPAAKVATTPNTTQTETKTDENNKEDK